MVGIILGLCRSFLHRNPEKEGLMGRATSRVSDVRVSGPLAPFAAGFRSRLADAGYTPLSAVNQMRLLAHLSRWLESAGLGRAGGPAVRKRASGACFVSECTRWW